MTPATRTPPVTGQWPSRAAGVTIAGPTGIAGAISYSHMRQLAQDHGQAGWHAHAVRCPLTASTSSPPSSCSPAAAKDAPAGCPGPPLIIGTSVSRPVGRHRVQRISLVSGQECVPERELCSCSWRR